MFTNWKTNAAIALAISGSVLVGCTKEQGAIFGGLGGAAAGAGIGYMITGDEKGAIIGGLLGAGIGATAGYFIGKEVEKQRASEQERARAQELGRQRFNEIRKQDPKRAQQMIDAAKQPVDPNSQVKPLRQAVEVAPNRYVAYDPATDIAGGDVYVAKGDDAKNLQAAKSDQKLAQLDGYNMLVQ
ncbi:MAG: glycine zipper domain-containing protein [Tepidisphaeraceae bacterium]